MYLLRPGPPNSQDQPWKCVERDLVRCFSFFLGGENGKFRNGSLLALPISSASAFSHNRGKGIRVYGLDRSGRIQSAVEQCRSEQLNGSDLVDESLIQENSNSNFVEFEYKVLRTNMGKNIKGMGLKKSGQMSTSLKSSRWKYVRKDGDGPDSALATVGPQASTEQCNSILKLLEQKSEEKALDFFEWMRSHAKLRGNSTAYNLALRVLSRKEDWKAAKTLLDEMDSDPDCELNSQVFNTLLFVCSKRGLVGRGTRWFQLMLDKGVQPNIATFGMLMGLYQKAGNLSEAEFTFNKMRSCGLQCVAAYSAIITIYTRLGLYGKSEEIIRLMREDKVKPNLENLLVQLNAYCQQGKLEEAETVFNSIQQSGFSANIVAYNTLITGYGKAGSTKAAQHLFHRLQTIGLRPDETTFRSMIEGYGRADSYTQALWYYNELKSSGFSPSSSNFYTMINLQAKHEDENGAIQTVADMRASGCPCASILGTLVQAYQRVGRVVNVPLIIKGSFYENVLFDPTSCSILALAFVKNSLLNDAIQVLREKKWQDSTIEDNLYHTLICSCKEVGRYEDAVTIFSQMPKSERGPNLHITSSVIDIYTCMSRFSDAEDLYLKLKSSGIPLDMVAYSIVVRMYLKSGLLKDACVVLDMMEKQKDINPDIFLYRDMLRIYQQCNMHEKLADVYYKLRKSTMTWDEAMYNCVINCCGRALPVDEISRLFDEMLKQGYTASTITFNVMLDIYGKVGLLKKASKVLQMARKQGLADVISYNTLIAAYGQHKDFKNMRYVVQQMQYAGFPVSLEAYNCMLDAYGKEDMLEEFNDVLQKMQEARCASDHYTYNIMINIYGKKGWIEDVAFVLDELRKHGLKPDLYSYNSLIKAYGIAGMTEEAVEIMKEMRRKGIHPDKVTYTNLIAALQRNENFLEAVKWSLWMKQMDMKV